MVYWELVLQLGSGACREWSLLHSHLLLNCIHKYTDIYNGIKLVEPLIGKWYLRVWSLLHIYLLLICVHKYMDIYDGIGLLTLNLESSVGESGIHSIAISF